MSEVLKDKVFQVINKAFIMVGVYLDLVVSQPAINPKQDSTVLETFLVNLLEKLADTKACIKVQGVYKRLFTIQQLECTYLLTFLFKTTSFVN